MCRCDLQALRADRCCYVMQQTWPVAAVYLDDGVGVGGMVVYYHARWHVHGVQPTTE
jgi:hypothetical protein